MRELFCRVHSRLIETAAILVAVLGGALPLIGSAASLPGNYETSWLGNSFSGANGKWVQNFFIHMNVLPNGECITWSHWDEGGKQFGIYKDGDVVGNEDRKANSLEVRDKKGRLWKLHVKYVDPENQEWEFVPEKITCDGEVVQFQDLFQPMAIALANDGSLMIADSGTGPRQQVLFFDVQDVAHPQLVRTLGERGGIRSGKPGEVKPDKFWGIRGIGMDAKENVYVAMSEQGAFLRKFNPQGKQEWELYDHFFVDLVSPDPKTDAGDVWGIQEHYVMDYNQAPGKEGQLVGYSLDRHRYPNDPRGLMHVKQQGEHGLTSPQIVYLEGKRFMFVGGMFASNFINVFRYEDEIAIPSALIMQWGNNLFRSNLKWPPHKPEGKTFIWRDLNGDGDYQAEEYFPNTDRVHPGPFWVDSKGNIWMAYGFFRYDFQGLDDKGNPVYSADKITVMDVPEGVHKVSRVWYDDVRDILVVADEGEDMRHVSEVFICKDYLKGNRKTVRFKPLAGKEAACVAVAGDYVFTGGWQERGRIGVNRISDGKEVGVLEPGERVGGVENTGWIDILTGISACKRANGEYHIFVEEDYKAKVLMYRWKP